jgi:hypothetical protein
MTLTGIAKKPPSKAGGEEKNEQNLCLRGLRGQKSAKITSGGWVWKDTKKGQCGFG